MGSLVLNLGLVPLLAVFVAIYLWAYKYVFNHEIIRNYSHRTVLSTLKINELIQECNTKHGLYLVSVENDDVGAENGSSTSNALLSSQPKTTTDRVVGAVFASGTALSIELIIVMLLQLTGSITVNLALLPILIKVLVAVVALVQPFLVISLYVNQLLFPMPLLSSPLSLIRMVVTFALLILWFIVLDRFGSIAAPLGESTGKSFLEEKTNDIVLAGITITAVLSGIGCALTPVRSWIEQRLGRSDSGPAKGDFRAVNDLIQSFNAAKMLEEKRLRELALLKQLSAGTIYNTPPKASGLRLMKQTGAQLFNKVQSFTNLSAFSGLESEEIELEREIASLIDLKQQVYSDLSYKLETILTSRTVSSDSRVNFQRLSLAFDIAFSVYCIYRIINVLVFRLAYLILMSGRQNKNLDDLSDHTRDALAITIAKLVQSLFGYLPMSEAQLINQISFLLSGSLFACSFQNVMVTFKTIGRFLPSNTTLTDQNIRGWLKNLIVSQFLAVYVIATALLIRSNLPQEAAQQILKVLSLSSSRGSSTLKGMLAEVDFVDAWFDKVFGFTSIATLVILSMKFYIEKDGITGDEFDEEMMMEEQSRAKFM
ncbi:hypothetical protein PUMCH_002743 [Australozyma saopauloensis]|uniref:Golgi pH regulator n=1 Tax=Australozyma saopauloensis TaxID=291208 RepID=A0AAX4HA41_9ASCO|nr:hypothetical protein PUMCH_002743 [[Candida] saopauloensis]